MPACIFLLTQSGYVVGMYALFVLYNTYQLPMIKNSVLILQIIGQELISCFYSLEPAGPVKDVTPDMWLVHCSACSNLLNLLQQSPSVYWFLLLLPTSK